MPVALSCVPEVMPAAVFVGLGAGVVYCGLWVDPVEGAAPRADPAPCAEPPPELGTVVPSCAAALVAADAVKG